jgi:hypothetical protein
MSRVWRSGGARGFGVVSAYRSPGSSARLQIRLLRDWEPLSLGCSCSIKSSWSASAKGLRASDEKSRSSRPPRHRRVLPRASPRLKIACSLPGNRYLSRRSRAFSGRLERARPGSSVLGGSTGGSMEDHPTAGPARASPDERLDAKAVVRDDGLGLLVIVQGEGGREHRPSAGLARFRKGGFARTSGCLSHPRNGTRRLSPRHARR